MIGAPMARAKGFRHPVGSIPVRLITYNVNSISARLPRLLALLAAYEPEIVCVQETKVAPETFPHLPLQAAGYTAVDQSKGRWAGVAILARHDLAIDDVRSGLVGEVVPEEARWVEATVGGLRVVSTYVPNGQEVGSEPFAQKLTFFEAMATRAAKLAGGPTVIAGDMNVCPTDLDVWDPAQVHGATHITAQERSRFDAVLATGFVDAFRTVQPQEPGFSWWDYRAGHFHKGYGLRIDLVLVSHPLAGRLRSAEVVRAYRKPTTVPDSKPSDHAPVVVDFADPVEET
jgi:exodeoxyribonuclease-3